MYATRIAWTIAKAASRALVEPQLADPCERFSLPMRVWALEADMTYVNHASYLVYFEAARWDLGLRCGFGNVLRTRRCLPTISKQLVQYRRPMRRGDTFDVVSRLLAVDERWWHFEQNVMRGDEVCTKSWAKVVMRDQNGACSPQDILQLAGYRGDLPNDFRTRDELVRELAT